MRIGRPLLKLPIRFCADTLAREVAALPQAAWMAHPQKYDGNIAVPLVTPGGAITDQIYGPMAATHWLQKCSYILEIMRELDSTWGRGRLMGLEPGSEVPVHADIHYYWRTHLRIHIPVVTNSAVAFTCNGETSHLAAGECWLLDSFYMHSVANRGSDLRVHLVLDTVGSGRLWDLIQSVLAGSDEQTFVEPGRRTSGSIGFEQINAPMVMSPWEMKNHLIYLSDWTDQQPGRDQIIAIFDRLIAAWTGVWARYGFSEEALPLYFQLLSDAEQSVVSFSGPLVVMRNDRPLLGAARHFILGHAIAPALRQRLQGAIHHRPVQTTA